jgi:hypothetical protein
MRGNKITVYFSCGAASAVAAKMTLALYGKHNEVEVVNFPIKEEHEDNLRFLEDVEKWLGVKIIRFTNKNYPNSSAKEVWEEKQYMSNIYGAICTTILKKQARWQYEKDNPNDYTVLGFTADEEHRHLRLINEEPIALLPVLINLKISKADCFKILLRDKIQLPHIYTLGFPNGNCVGCVKSQSPTYWNLVRLHFPLIFKDRAEQSRKIGCKLVRFKGKRIFLDELPPDAKGGKIKSWDCGTFCETSAK